MANQQWWTSGMNVGTPNASGTNYQAPQPWTYTPPQMPAVNPGGNIMGGTPAPSATLPAHGYVPSVPANMQTLQNYDPRQLWQNAMGGSVVPNGWEQGQGQSPQQPGPIWNMWDPNTYKRDWETVNRYLSGWYYPQQEQMQNAYQWGSEFDEAQRRWDSEMQMQSLMNQYGIDLQTRQQQMAEWEAGEAARQWGEQFGWTQQTDTWSKQLAEQELAQRELIQQMQNQAALEQARVGAFGRAVAPNVRYTRNWG